LLQQALPWELQAALRAPEADVLPEARCSHPLGQLALEAEKKPV